MQKIADLSSCYSEATQLQRLKIVVVSYLHIYCVGLQFEKCDVCQFFVLISHGMTHKNVTVTKIQHKDTNCITIWVKNPWLYVMSEGGVYTHFSASTTFCGEKSWLQTI